MKKIPYLDILKSAFLITWKNRFLWFLGFLVFLGSITSNFNLNDNSVIEQGQDTAVVATFVQHNPSASLILTVIMIALFLLRITAMAGIVKAINDINLYRQLSIVAILGEAKKYLGRLLLLELLIGVALAVVSLILAVPVIYLFALKAKLLAIGILILAIAIILPLLILAFYLYKYASLYIILANEKIKIALEMAYVVFAKNIKESLMLSLMVVAGNLLLVMAIFFLIIPLAIVFAPLGLLAYWIFAKIGAFVVLTIAISCYALLITVIISWYEAFLQAVWLFFFQQIAFEKDKEKKILEKLEVEGSVPNPEAV
jgi:hypothetical protein